MLRLNNVSKTYNSKSGIAVKALNGVSLDFADSGLVFIIGKSGSGKSTLLNVLGGLDAPDEGELIVKGRSSKTFTASDFDSYRNTYCGFVFQEYNLIDNYTVGANIGLALELRGGKADRNEIDAVMRRMELTDERGETMYSRHTNELSGGQKQRIAIARALIKNPEIILADEPTGALDSETGARLYDTLKELAKDKLIIVVSHDLDSAEKYGDRIIELWDGRVIKDTAPYSRESKSDLETSAFTRSRLPFRRILSMGASGLSVKKFRLAMSVILSAVAFMIFGFSVTASFADPLRSEIEQAYQCGQQTFILSNFQKRAETMDSPTNFTDTQMAMIDEYNGGRPPLMHGVGVYTSSSVVRVNLSYHIGVETYYQFSSSTPYGKYAEVASGIGGFVEINSETGERDANLRPDDRLIDKSKNRLPQTFDEIAITDMHADLFLRYGFIEQRTNSEGEEIKDPEVVPINAPDDLIGKTLGEWDPVNEKWLTRPFTIVGVYSTEQNRTEIESVLEGRSGESNEYISAFSRGVSHSPVTCGYVKAGLFDYIIDSSDNIPAATLEHAGRSCFLMKFSGDAERDAAFIESLSVTENGNEYIVDIHTPFSGFVGNAEMYIFWMVRVGFVAACIFAVFSALLMMNFLNVSIDCKKREMGILRALGARKIEIAAICLVESLLVLGIQVAVAAVCTAVLCAALNLTLYMLPILRFGMVQIALILLLGLSVTVLATVLPVLKVTNKKPVDIINGR